jgi:outer membrane lipoprotein-sorting protein
MREWWIMTRLLSSSLFLLTWLLVRPAASPVQTADDLVEKHLAAVGGRPALSKLTSRKSTGTVTIGTPNGDLSGPIEIYAKPPNKVRAYMELDLTALGGPGKMVLEQKFDGTAGWMLNSMQGNTAIVGNQLQNMRNNMFPTPLMSYKAAGTKVDVLPKEQVGGKDAVVLLVTPKEGSVARIFLDAESYLIVRTISKISTPEVGEFEQTIEPSDYRSVDGVKVAFVVKNTSPVQSLTIRLDKVEHNVPIDDAMFVVKSPIGAAR